MPIDNVFYINSASIDVGQFTGSFQGDGSQLINLPIPSTVSTASYVAGGNVDGTVASATSASYALSASWAPDLTSVTASHATYAETAGTADTATTANTASYVLGSNVDGNVTSAVSSSYVVGLPNFKAGLADYSQFTVDSGTGVYIYTVLFQTPFSTPGGDAIAVSIGGAMARLWTVENKSDTGFIISTNSKQPPTENATWMAMTFSDV